MCLQQLRIAHRAVLQNAFTGFKAQVEAIELGVTLLQTIHHPQALQVVLKPTIGRHALVQSVLPRMAKRRVAQVVRQGNGLNQVLMQTQCAGHGTGQLRHLQRMRQAGAEQVAFMV